MQRRPEAILGLVDVELTVPKPSKDMAGANVPGRGLDQARRVLLAMGMRETFCSIEGCILVRSVELVKNPHDIV